MGVAITLGFCFQNMGDMRTVNYEGRDNHNFQIHIPAVNQHGIDCG